MPLPSLSRLLDVVRPPAVEHPGGAPEYTILYPPTLLWSNFQRPQNILTQLARHHDVRALFHDWTVRDDRLEGGRLIVTKRAFRARYHARPLVFYFSVPEKLNYVPKKGLAPDLVAFELMDVPEHEFAVWKEHLPQALARADVIRTTERGITDYLLERYGDVLDGKPVLTSCNGVDLERFDPGRPYPRPAELLGIDKPILGFYGNLDAWIDWALVARLAALPDYQVVILGGAEGRRPRIPEEVERSSVRFLGWKPVGELPAYLSCFAVALFPFVVNEMTDAVDALKLWEYLAFGKPVLATPTRFIRDRADVFEIVDPEEPDLEAAVARAIASGGDTVRVAARRAAAAERDWKRIAEGLHEEIVKRLGDGGRGTG